MGSSTDAPAIEFLRVRGLVNPLSLGSGEPIFSWLRCAGTAQVGYQIRVASSPEDLAADRLVWDSGYVQSSDTFDIRYPGPRPNRGERFYWSVTSWDDGGVNSSSFQTAYWETGPLDGEQWSAEWIAVEHPEAAADRSVGLHWIWGPEDQPDETLRYFRFAFDSPAETSGLLLISANRLEAVWLNGVPVEANDEEPICWTTMASFPLALRQGQNVIAVTVRKAPALRFYYPPSAYAAALAAIVRLAPNGGLRLSSKSGWKTALDAIEGWNTPGYDEEGWRDAMPADPSPLGEPWLPHPAMYLRRGFEVSRGLRAARLYASALGTYEAYVNGSKVSSCLTPEATDPSKRLVYNAYDVTEQVKVGTNCLGLLVGDGWYASEYAMFSRFLFGPAPCRVIAELDLLYNDGSRKTVKTGPGWRSHPSPVLSSEVYDGEVYDARNEIENWASPTFDDSGWQEGAQAGSPPIPLEAQGASPLGRTAVLDAQAITEPKAGVFVYDFGQNFAGWARLCVSGPRGMAIKLRFAEVLGADGQVDQTNLRSAFATDTYILKGEGVEIWEPRFTYHGFRYVQASGFLTPPSIQTIKGVVVHADLTPTATLNTGDVVINRLWLNSTWSQRSNFMGMPTDCPQRDERLAWLGDAQAFWTAAAFNMDVQAYTGRFMADVRHGQFSEGGFPDVVPALYPGLEWTTPGWADAGIILPYVCWQQYGDTAIIRENWDAMEKYSAFLQRENPDFLWTNRRGLDLGDWLAVDAQSPIEATRDLEAWLKNDQGTPKDLIATAFWAHTSKLMSEMAGAIGKSSDAARYRHIRSCIETAFNRAFVREDAVVGSGSQTSYALALQFELVPEQLRTRAATHLSAAIEARGGKVSTGFLGTPYILDALADNGQEQAAIDLLLQRDYPSWGYMVEHGATTIWERWNSDTDDNPMRSSFNHYAFGAVASFLFRRVAGIAARSPGFRNIEVAPLFDPRLSPVCATYHSVIGPISTGWRWTQRGVDLTINVPQGSLAKVKLPKGWKTRGSRSEKPLSRLQCPPGKHQIRAELSS